MQQRLGTFFIVVGILLLAASRLFASAADIYGLSSRATATAGLSNYASPDAYATYQNPAFLTGAKKIQMSIGMMNAMDSFLPIEDVVVQNETSGKSLEYGDVKTDYANLSGANFGVVLPWKKITLGVTGFVPFGSLISVNTEEKYVPVYGAYHTRPKRFSLVSGVAAEIFENFSLGVAGNFYFSSAASTHINLNGPNAEVNLAMDIKPALAPIVGAHYIKNDWSFDLSYRGPVNYAMQLAGQADSVFLGAINVKGEIEFPMMKFLTNASTFYDPAMLVMGISKLFKKGVQIGTRMAWKNWKRYQASASQSELSLQNPADMVSKQPQIKFRDIVSSSLGIEFPIKSYLLRMGYRYEPEHVAFQEANSNFIDTNAHIMSTGLGKSFKDPFGFWPYDMNLDLHVQYHYLTPKHVEKLDSQAMGYKKGGYDVGGSLFNYGLTLTTTL